MRLNDSHEKNLCHHSLPGIYGERWSLFFVQECGEWKRTDSIKPVWPRAHFYKYVYVHNRKKNCTCTFDFNKPFHKISQNQRQTIYSMIIHSTLSFSSQNTFLHNCPNTVIGNSRTTSFHPEGNRKVQRFTRTLLQIQRALFILSVIRPSPKVTRETETNDQQQDTKKTNARSRQKSTRKAQKVKRAEC